MTSEPPRHDRPFAPAEGLNDAGEAAFIVDVEDNTVLEGLRSAIYLATPKKPLR